MADRKRKAKLIESAEWENVEDVRTLIESGANVNAKDSHGRTLLMEARDAESVLDLIPVSLDS